MRHIKITRTHYSHISAPPTTRSDGFLWTTTFSCCCNARSSSSNSSNTSCCCNIHAAATLYRAKITPAQAVICWRRVPTLQQQQSSSIPGRHRRTWRRTSLQLSVRRCPPSGPTSRSCIGGSVRGTNQGKNVTLPASPRRLGVSSLHSQRYEDFDPTFDKASYYIIHPRRFARNASYERSCLLFLADNVPGTPKKVVVVAVVHHISWATARAARQNTWAASWARWT